MVLSQDSFKVTIITVNLNNCQGLFKTIKSIIGQRFVSIEFIVIDGKSTDGSITVIRQFENQIASWISEPDNGIYNAMNKGIEKAKGEYLLFLNSGDYLATDTTLSEIFDHSNHSESILYGEIACKINGELHYSKVPEKLTLNTFFYSTVPHQAAFIRRELFETFGKYNENLKVAADLEFWIKTIVLSSVTYRKLNLLVAVREGDGISDKNFDQNKIPEENLLIYNDLIPEAILNDYLEWFGSGMSPNKYFVQWLLNRKALLKLLKLLYRTNRIIHRKGGR